MMIREKNRGIPHHKQCVEIQLCIPTHFYKMLQGFVSNLLSRMVQVDFPPFLHIIVQI